MPIGLNGRRCEESPFSEKERERGQESLNFGNDEMWCLRVIDGEIIGVKKKKKRG
jgi:hypothetical protein